MPNWCYQSLELRGDITERERFIKAITVSESEKVYTISDLDPCQPELLGTTATLAYPEPLESWAQGLANGDITQEWYDELVSRNASIYQKQQENIAKYGYKDWYERNVAEWGSKWGDHETEVLTHDDERTVVTFCSAWSPLNELIVKVSSMFPSLFFGLRAIEEGLDYAGWLIFQNGRDVEDRFASGEALEGINEETLVDYLEQQLTNALDKAVSSK